MSLNLPLRPLTRSSALKGRPTQSCSSFIPQRTLFNGLFGRSNNKTPKLDPLSDDFLKKGNKQKLPQAPQQGALSSSSIFDEVENLQRPDASTTSQVPAERQRPRVDPSLRLEALDPNPKARRRWERKMVIRDIQHRGRISREVKLARTERSHLSKSAFWYTSIKKLGPLARQIAGKPIDEAIVQMRFSKKKAAQDVKRHLELARDEAIVARGMGLGTVSSQEGNNETGQNSEETPIKFIDKAGKRRVTENVTNMYVDEAWVNRGPYIMTPEYRARGRVNMLRHPHTSISVVLKEEKTRIRQAMEREAKKASKKPWIHHPDRPITRQSQYVLW